MKTPNDLSEPSPDEPATRSIGEATAAQGERPPAIGIGTILDGKYRIEEALGSGGMGTVFAALHLHLGQRVALKFLSGAVPDTRRFRREARIAFALRSEHVARLLDTGTDSHGSRFLVMELLVGETLRERLRRSGPSSVREASDFVLQACEGIAEAHALGIVHRDLKLANLMVTHRRDGSPLLKVLDFGIAKLLAETHGSALGSRSKELETAPTSILGSLLYMSPEQLASSRDVEQRTDVWALGVVLHELVTGVVPFTGRNPRELKESFARGFDKATVRARAPEAWVDIVACCLSVARSDRWSSVAELARALEPFASADARLHATRAAGALGRSRSTADAQTGPASPHALGGTHSRTIRAFGLVAGAIVAASAIATLTYPLVMGKDVAAHSASRPTRARIEPFGSEMAPTTSQPGLLALAVPTMTGAPSAAPLSASSAPSISTHIARGDHVDVQWGNADTWWPAVVLDEQGDRYLVHYDGYTDTWNEWVGAARIRR